MALVILFENVLFAMKSTMMLMTYIMVTALRVHLVAATFCLSWAMVMTRPNTGPLPWLFGGGLLLARVLCLRDAYC